MKTVSTPEGSPRELRAAHRAANRMARRLHPLFIGAVDDARGRFPLERAAELLEGGRLFPVVELGRGLELGQQIRHDLLELYRSSIVDAARRQARAMSSFLRSVVGKADGDEIRVDDPAGGQVTLDLNKPTPVAEDIAATRAARLVREITESQRIAIREATVRAIREGIPPRDLARLIRDMIGLTQRDARAVANFRLNAARQLAEQGVALGRAEERASELASRYSRRLLRHRAETIARNESIWSANRATELVWEKSQEAGLFEGSQTEKVWILTPDERLCPLCRPMAGARVPLDQPFEHPWLGAVRPGSLHVQCRCGQGLVFDGEVDSEKQSDLPPFRPPKRRLKPKVTRGRKAA